MCLCLFAFQECLVWFVSSLYYIWVILLWILKVWKRKIINRIFIGLFKWVYACSSKASVEWIWSRNWWGEHHIQSADSHLVEPFVQGQAREKVRMDGFEWVEVGEHSMFVL